MTTHPAAVTLFLLTLLLSTPLQSDQIAELGSVEFSNSCATNSQQPLNEAMAVLHSFWHDEAIRRFSQLVAADRGLCDGLLGPGDELCTNCMESSIGKDARSGTKSN